MDQLFQKHKLLGEDTNGFLHIYHSLSPKPFELDALIMHKSTYFCWNSSYWGSKSKSRQYKLVLSWTKHPL